MAAAKPVDFLTERTPNCPLRPRALPLADSEGPNDLSEANREDSLHVRRREETTAELETGGRMFESTDSIASVAHIIQVALTPVFLLSGIASLLSVFSIRLGRVADHVDAFSEKLENADSSERQRLQARLNYLRRRTFLLDIAVMLGTLGGAATCLAALLLFVGTLREQAGISMFVAFGLALLFTVGALVAFLAEMLLASRGIRIEVAKADEPGETPEPLELSAAGGSTSPTE